MKYYHAGGEKQSLHSYTPHVIITFIVTEVQVWIHHKNAA